MQMNCDERADGNVYELAILFARMWGIAETLEPLPNRSIKEVRDKVTVWAAECAGCREEDFVKFFAGKIEEEFSLELSADFGSCRPE